VRVWHFFFVFFLRSGMVGEWPCLGLGRWREREIRDSGVRYHQMRIDKIMTDMVLVGCPHRRVGTREVHCLVHCACRPARNASIRLWRDSVISVCITSFHRGVSGDNKVTGLSGRPITDRAQTYRH
jgi:hypothetical protein